MSPSVEPPRGGVYARRAVGALSSRFPDVTSSAYCVWLLERAGASVGLGVIGGVSGGDSVSDAVVGWGSGCCSRVS